VKYIYYIFIALAVIFNLTGCTSTNEDEIIMEKDKNQQGNTAGNIKNYAFVAEQGDWIFYKNHSESFIPLLDKKSGLFKMRKDGKQVTKINRDLPYYINVVGDWIYYSIDTGLSRPNSKLYKVKIDVPKNNYFLMMMWLILML
jgi:hypothetical protein